jgi:hypothetical protein
MFRRLFSNKNTKPSKQPSKKPSTRKATPRKAKSPSYNKQYERKGNDETTEVDDFVIVSNKVPSISYGKPKTKKNQPKKLTRTEQKRLKKNLEHLKNLNIAFDNGAFISSPRVFQAESLDDSHDDLFPVTQEEEEERLREKLREKLREVGLGIKKKKTKKRRKQRKRTAKTAAKKRAKTAAKKRAKTAARKTKA